MRALDHPLRVSRQVRAATARRCGDGCRSSAVYISFCGCAGIFYAGGVKADALFFDRKPPETGASRPGPITTGTRPTENRRRMIRDGLELRGTSSGSSVDLLPDRGWARLGLVPSLVAWPLLHGGPPSFSRTGIGAPGSSPAPPAADAGHARHPRHDHPAAHR